MCRLEYSLKACCAWHGSCNYAMDVALLPSAFHGQIRRQAVLTICNTTCYPVVCFFARAFFWVCVCLILPCLNSIEHMAIPCFAQMPSSSTMLVLHLSTTRLFILYLFELFKVFTPLNLLLSSAFCLSRFHSHYSCLPIQYNVRLYSAQRL